MSLGTITIMTRFGRDGERPMVDGASGVVPSWSGLGGVVSSWRVMFFLRLWWLWWSGKVVVEWTSLRGKRLTFGVFAIKNFFGYSQQDFSLFLDK